MTDPVLRVLTAYPQIYLACHTHHAGRQSGAALTDREVLVVGHLVDGAIGVGALARHMGVTQSTMTAAVFSLTASRASAKSFAPLFGSMKRTPGIRGSNGLRYFSCSVIESAPIVLPWNELTSATNSVPTSCLTT